MSFGQVVIGPPGSGKTTYCCVDITDLVCLRAVMENHGLGPNGGLIFCMSHIDANFHWLAERLEKFRGKYILFDFPGQVELYTHETTMHSILQKLQRLQYRLSVVHLVDSHHCTDSSKFIAVVLMSLASMVRLELPHINVLSKMDLLQQSHALAYNVDFYTEVMDLRRLLNWMEEDRLGDSEKHNADSDMEQIQRRQHRPTRYRRLHEALIDVIEDFSLVSFYPIQIGDAESLKTALLAIDKSNGYVYTSVDWSTAVAVDPLMHAETISDLQERYADVCLSATISDD